MSEILTPDICVVGAGSAGLSVAAAAAAFGVPTILVEKGRMGGECLNTGCVPSKALIAAARHAKEARRAAAFGISTGRVAADFPAVMRHVRGVIAEIAPNDSAARFTAMGVTVLAGHARFTDRRSLLVGDKTIRARRFVVATGSRPALPPIEGLAETVHLTNETLFDNDVLPGHLAVIGAGAVGLEMAQAFRRLGAAVTVLESGTALSREDGELSRLVVEALRAEGVEIVEGAEIARISGREGAVRVAFAHAGLEREIEASHLLVAAGRRANVEGLGLDAAGIAMGERGIRVDSGLKTSNRRVYAIGDVVGDMQFTHVANYHAGLVIRSALFRMPVRVDRDKFPRVTFTDPEIAQVGLTEAEAKARHSRIGVHRWPFGENDRARAERATDGLIKLVTSRTGRIVGATIVGAGAGEMANMWSLALSQNLNIRALTGFVPPYPTLGEVGKRAALSYYAGSADHPFVQRALGFLRKLG